MQCHKSSSMNLNNTLYPFSRSLYCGFRPRANSRMMWDWVHQSYIHTHNIRSHVCSLSTRSEYQAIFCERARACSSGAVYCKSDSYMRILQRSDRSWDSNIDGQTWVGVSCMVGKHIACACLPYTILQPPLWLAQTSHCQFTGNNSNEYGVQLYEYPIEYTYNYSYFFRLNL